MQCAIERAILYRTAFYKLEIILPKKVELLGRP